MFSKIFGWIKGVFTGKKFETIVDDGKIVIEDGKQIVIDAEKLAADVEKTVSDTKAHDFRTGKIDKGAHSRNQPTNKHKPNGQNDHTR